MIGLEPRRRRSCLRRRLRDILCQRLVLVRIAQHRLHCRAVSIWDRFHPLYFSYVLLTSLESLHGTSTSSSLPSARTNTTRPIPPSAPAKTSVTSKPSGVVSGAIPKSSA